MVPALDLLLATAEEHDVAGLAAAALLTEPSRGLTDDVLEGLTIYCEGVRLEARRADAQLQSLLHLLGSRGLAAMPFKGPVLAHAAYADPGLRLCLDLDLMVHPDDVSPVLACLIDAGFRHQDALDSTGISVLRRYAGEYILFRPGSLAVEPHWHPAPRTMAFDFDIDALWRRARQASFLGAPCYEPSDADHLLLLALHGAKEQWHKLKWLVDVAAFLKSHPLLDLAALRELPGALGCRRVLDLALLLSHRLFAIPSAAPRADAATRSLAERVIARLERTAEAPPGPYVVSSFHFRLRERQRDRARYVARTLLTPRVAHYRRLPLPPTLRWLHVPLKLPWDFVVTPAVGLARRLATASK